MGVECILINLVLLSSPLAIALENGLGRVPIKGVTSWCMQGQCGWDRCWDAQYRSLADSMVSEGMLSAGYRYLHVDDCWVAGRNVTTGELYPDSDRFPHGMKALVDYVHSRGLLFGIYTDVTTAPCIHGQYDREKGFVPGSWGHYEQDAATFASWGVDYVKADFCESTLNNGSVIDAEVAYSMFSKALNKTGRPMYFLACYDRWLNKTSGRPKTGFQAPWEWIHPVANAYRLSSDHHDNWSELLAEIELNANTANNSIPGSFGDWDALVTGGQGCTSGPTPTPTSTPTPTLAPTPTSTPTPTPTSPPQHRECNGPGAVNCGPRGGGEAGARCPNMTMTEYRTSFSIWLLGASPLMIDADIRNMSKAQRDILLHPEMLNIHGDMMGVGGSRIGCAFASASASASAPASASASASASVSVSVSGGRHITSTSNHTRGRSLSNTLSRTVYSEAKGCLGQVWSKQLVNNESAIALFNTASTPQYLNFSFTLLGYTENTRLHVRDVWQSKDIGISTGWFQYPTTIDAHGTTVLRVSVPKGESTTSSL